MKLITLVLFIYFYGAEATFPGEKLLATNEYGFDEYLVSFLAFFIFFVIVKHLIFHTGYFWWHSVGRFYLPDKFWSLITGKHLNERIYSHIEQHCISSPTFECVLKLIDEYCKTKEFAASFGQEKGKILKNVIDEIKPKQILIVGMSYGFVMLKMLESSDADLYVIDEDINNIIYGKKLAKLLNKSVNFICENPLEAVKKSRDYFGKVDRFDLVFLSRKRHHQPTNLKLLKLLEGGMQNQQQLISSGSCIFADKVVFFSDPTYLLYVRQSPIYQSTYHQMALEHSSYEVLDGIEISKMFTK